MSRRAVIYTRVSRDDEAKRLAQAGDGDAGTTLRGSSETQLSRCQHLASAHGWNVVAVEHDVSVSAYSGRLRPGWERVLGLVDRGEVDVVLSWHMDRMTRSMTDLEQLILIAEKHGVGVVTVEGDINLTTEMGRMVARILTAVARAEVERKGERQKRANQQRRAEGKRWASGWRPFGYELDGTLVQEEAELIRQAATDVLTGTSLREIARRWREAGVSTPRSEKGAEGWTHSGVRAILLSPRNAGLNTYQGEVIGPGDWEPTFGEDVHAQLVAKLSASSRKTSRRQGRSPANLLSGIAMCATCREPVTGGTVGRTTMVEGVRKSTGLRVAVYKCPNNHLSTNRADVDGLVRSAYAVGIRLINAQTLIPIVRSGDGADLQAEAERIRSDLRDLAVSYADRRITLAQMELATAALQEQMEHVESKLAEAPGSEAVAELLDRAARDFLAMTTDQQRALLSRTTRIVLHPKGRGKKSVPAEHQVTMHAIQQRHHAKTDSDSSRLVPLLDERPAALTAVNTEPQKRDRAR